MATFEQNYERIEKKIETVEYALRQENTPENRSKIHGAYQSVIKLSKKFEDPKLVELCIACAEVIEGITIKKIPNFKFHKKKC